MAKRSQVQGDTSVLKRNFIIFHHRSKRITFLESVNFSTCFYVQIFNLFYWWSRDHFSAPFMGLYLPNAWSQTPLRGFAAEIVISAENPQSGGEDASYCEKFVISI